MSSKANFHERLSLRPNRPFWSQRFVYAESFHLWAEVAEKFHTNSQLVIGWELLKDFFSQHVYRLNWIFLWQRSTLGRGTQTMQTWAWEDFHSLVSFADIIHSVMINLSLLPTNLSCCNHKIFSASKVFSIL